MKKKPNHPRWLDRALVVSPYYYTLCTTEKQFIRELKKLELPRCEWPPFKKHKHSGAMLNYFEAGNGNLVGILTIEPRDDKTLEQIYALLAHEAMHLWRAIREHLGETTPSAEFEAYAVQNIAQSFMEEYKRQTQ